MNLAQALKEKSRLAGEIARKQQIFAREHSRNANSKSELNRQELYDDIVNLTDDLIVLKSKIAKANIGIYHKIMEMAELKSRITYLNSLPIQENCTQRDYTGNVVMVCFDNHFSRREIDDKIETIQRAINVLQDEIDVYNGTTVI